MCIVALERNYVPIDLETRYHVCLRKVESSWRIKKILSFYHIRRPSLYRWLLLFDQLGLNGKKVITKMFAI